MIRRPLSALVFAVALALAGCGGSDEEAEGPPFEPRATLEATGGTARAEKPTLTFRVAARRGDAKIRSIAVELPPVLIVDAVSLGKICSERELEADECRGHRPLGFARVRSPLFRAPLSGPVFLVSGGSAPLLGLAYLLEGPANAVLRGRVESAGGRIEATVDEIPDVPVRSMVLTIAGGERGFLQLSRDICQAEARADGMFTSQDGQSHRERIPLEADCPG